MKNLRYSAIAFITLTVIILPKISLAGFDMTLRNPIGDSYLNTVAGYLDAKINNWFDNDKTTNNLKMKFDFFNGSMCTTTNANGHADFHRGTDFPVNESSPVVSVGAGRIYQKISFCEDTGGEFDTCGGSFGNHYKIDHEGDTSDGKGLVTVYAHLKGNLTGQYMNLNVGQKVSCGQELGKSSMSGHVTGYHLHFAVSTKGENIVANYIDPFVGMCSRPNGNSEGLSRWTSIDTNEQPTTECDPHPLAPSNVIVTNSGQSETELTFSYKDNALNDTSIKMERKMGAGAWKYIFDIASSNTQNQFEYFVNSGLVPGTRYCYRLKSVNNGIESPYSNEACGTTKISNSAPLAPSSLSVYSQGFKTLRIDFKDNASNETDIKLERSVGWFNRNYAGYKSLGALEGAESRTFTDVGLFSFQRYCYRLKAVNSFGSSTYSEEKCGNTLISPDAPKAPSNLVINSNNTNTNSKQKDNVVTNATGPVLQISFIDNAIDETEFRIERKVGSAEYTSYRHIPSYAGTGLQTFTDESIAMGATYCYKVRAYNSINNVGYSDYSNEVCGSATSTDAIPNTPSEVYISDITTNSLKVYFKDNALNEKFITIEGKTGTNGVWQTLATYGTLAEAKYWYITHTELLSNTTYCYRLKASNSFGASPYSNEACGTTIGGGSTPLAPSNLSITDSTANTLRVNFKDNSLNETSFTMERKSGSESFSYLLSISALSGDSYQYYTDTSLPPGATYCYRLRAHNAYGVSLYSNEACGTTLGLVPNTPSNMRITEPTANSLRVNFRDNSVNENYFILQRKIGMNGTWENAGNFESVYGTGEIYWYNIGLFSNTIYCYRANAVNNFGSSVYSNEACGTTSNIGTTPVTPSGVFVSDATTNSLRFNFSDNATNENSFVLDRKTGVNGVWAGLFSLNALSGTGTWSLNNTNLSSGITYCYRIKAVNAYGSSPYSSESCGTTIGGLVPNAPGNILISNLTSSSLRMNFRDNALNEMSFVIERKIGSGGFWYLVETLDALSGNYSQWLQYYNLSPKTMYCYRMKAVNSYGSSAYSNEGCGVTL